MQRSTSRRRISTSEPQAPIAIATVTRGTVPSRYGLLLVVLMRLIAIIWVGEGLLQWANVLLTSTDGQSGLAALNNPAIVAVVFFAVIDPIAAVGLWMATPWGAVIWLVTAGAQLFVIGSMPDFFDRPFLTGVVTIVLVLAYLVLTWRVAAEGHGAPARR